LSEVEEDRKKQSKETVALLKGQFLKVGPLGEIMTLE
jgi:hypothetical protein